MQTGLHASSRIPLMVAGVFQMVLDDDTGEREGCYLYLHNDGERCQWIRSGKAVGLNQTLKQRHNNHKASARLRNTKDLDSTFYVSYPDRTAVYSNNVRKGFFDELVPYVALGFARQSPSSLDSLYSTGTSESIFSWPDNHLKRLTAVKFKGVGDNDVKEKQLHAIGCT